MLGPMKVGTKVAAVPPNRTFLTGWQSFGYDE